MARWLQRPCDFFASVVSPSGDITSRLLFSRGPDPTLDAVLRGILTYATDYLLYDLSYTTCVMRFFLTVPCSANYVWVHLLFHDECCGNGILDGYDASPKRHGGNLLLFFLLFHHDLYLSLTHHFLSWLFFFSCMLWLRCWVERKRGCRIEWLDDLELCHSLSLFSFELFFLCTFYVPITNHSWLWICPTWGRMTDRLLWWILSTF